MGWDAGVILTTLGFSSFAIAFALRRLIKDVVGSFILVFGKPFEAGDYISVMKDYGMVKQIGLRATILKGIDGDEIIIPNSVLIEKNVQNYKQRLGYRLGYDVKIPTKRVSKYTRPFERVTKRLYKEFPQIINNSLESILVTLTEEKVTYRFQMQVSIKDRSELDEINKELVHKIHEEFKKESVSIEEITLVEKGFIR
jgi:MscS family membrane protein